jgi:alanine racemase
VTGVGAGIGEGRRPVWADVDLGAARRNVERLVALASPSTVCAVVKADGYGHGAVAMAEAALAGGATWLAVAIVEEGDALRSAGITAPVLLLSEPPHGAFADVVALGLTPTVYTVAGVEAAAKAVASAPGRGEALPLHVKVDTGMHRVGAAPSDAVQLVSAIADRPEVRLEGLWTHLAVADDPGNEFTDDQARVFAQVVGALAARGVRPPVIHSCNSAATINQPALRQDMVRCGITLYGVPPSPALAGRVELSPAMALRARVSQVKRIGAGEGVSYGLRYRVDRPATIATVPVGYADGVPWRLGVTGGEVLLSGRRRPIAGSVTMDQILVDCGDDEVAAGDEVVLLGGQDGDSIGAWDWAERVGTIAYEVLCGIGARVPRRYHS